MREDGTNSSLSPGSLNSCALKFANNAGTGFISPTPGTLGLVASGILGLTLAASGDVTISKGLLVTETLSLAGAVTRPAPVVVTSNFTVTPSVSKYICNGTGTITVTLPNAGSYVGVELVIKTVAAQAVVSDASNVAPLVGGSLSTSILSATAGKWASLVSNGSYWIIMSSN
jgi:hypothetical protein